MCGGRAHGHAHEDQAFQSFDERDGTAQRIAAMSAARTRLLYGVDPDDLQADLALARWSADVLDAKRAAFRRA